MSPNLSTNIVFFFTRKASCAKKSDLFRRKEDNGAADTCPRVIRSCSPGRCRIRKMSYLWEVVVYWYEAVACKSGAGLPPNGVGRLGETGSDGCGAGRFSRPGSWSPLAPLSGNIPAMRWLVRQIRLCNPVPPEQPHGRPHSSCWRLSVRTIGFSASSSTPGATTAGRERPRPAVLCACPVAGQPAGGISPSECPLQPDDGGCASPISILCRAGRPWLRNLLADRARFPRPCEIPSRLPPLRSPGAGAGSAKPDDGDADRRGAGPCMLHVRLRLPPAVPAGVRHPRLRMAPPAAHGADRAGCSGRRTSRSVRWRKRTAFGCPPRSRITAAAIFGAPPGQLRRQLAEPGNGLCSEISGL